MIFDQIGVYTLGAGPNSNGPNFTRDCIDFLRCLQSEIPEAGTQFEHVKQNVSNMSGMNGRILKPNDQ